LAYKIHRLTSENFHPPLYPLPSREGRFKKQVIMEYIKTKEIKKKIRISGLILKLSFQPKSFSTHHLQIVINQLRNNLKSPPIIGGDRYQLTLNLPHDGAS
jgi:hypothetical protein